MRLLYLGLCPEEEESGYPSGLQLQQFLALERSIALDITMAEGLLPALTLLRERPFDIALIYSSLPKKELLEAISALCVSGFDATRGLLVLGIQPETEIGIDCHHAGADCYQSLANTTPATLSLQLQKVEEKYQILAENDRLLRENQTQLQTESHTVGNIIKDQQTVISELEKLSKINAMRLASRTHNPTEEPSQADQGEPFFPEGLVRIYQTFLQKHIVYGNLAHETITAFSSQLVAEGLAPRECIALHIQSVQKIIQDQGTKSATHTIRKADTLLIELLAVQAEQYAQRSKEP
ncbi:MAG: hypothetical protein MPJ24_04145, partial [Pirellulaceae bacterium]|nr:hypothetical protein [Pirellulaceae bacterium]